MSPTFRLSILHALLLAFLVLITPAAALAQTGTLVQWSQSNTTGRPSVAQPYIAMGCGSMHTVALRPDGAIEQWGSNALHSLDNPPPPGMRFRAIAVGYYHNVGLREDGTIYQWGNIDDGRAQGIPGPGEHFVSISAGGSHSLALRADGSMVQWGNTTHGEADGMPAPTDRFTVIIAGSGASMAIRADGTWVQWGGHILPQIGGPINDRLIGGAMGHHHSLGIRTDGSVVQWGAGDASLRSNFPGPDERFIAVAGGFGFSVGIRTDGTIHQWGPTSNGQLNGAPAPTERFSSLSMCLQQVGALRASTGATAFTYQGNLTTDEAGPFDLRFSIFDAPAGGVRISPSVVAPSVQPDSRGVFSVKLDFGLLDYTRPQYLNIEAALASSTVFTALNPRQELTGVPKAAFAESAAVADLAASATFAENAATADLADAVPWNGILNIPANVTTAFSPWRATPVSGHIYFNTGNVGIGSGVTFPVVPLEVGGNGTMLRLSGANSCVMDFFHGEGRRGQIGFLTPGSNDLTIRSGNFAGTRVVLGGINGDGLFVDQSRIGIAQRNPEAHLHITHGSLAATQWLGMLIDNTAQAGFRGGIRMSNDGFLDLTNNARALNPSFARLSSSGNWSAVSDARLKHDIQPADDLLAAVAALQPVTYRYKSQKDDARHLGFLAQDVQAVLPDLVTEGEIVTLDYSRLSVAAIGAINQLRVEKDRQMDDLREENVQLRRSLDELSRRLEALEQKSQ